MVKVTVEETNVESMDTTDAGDTETITLTRNKVWFAYYMCIKGVLQGVWNVTSATNGNYMLAGDLHLMVRIQNLTFYLHPLSGGRKGKVHLHGHPLSEQFGNAGCRQ